MAAARKRARSRLESPVAIARGRIGALSCTGHEHSQSSATAEVAFYCVADAAYFGGAVGLVNSLRLLGHAEPIHLLDCGLTPAQRELLAAEVELLPAPDDSPPWLLKTVAPLARPAEVMVLLDVDMVATRRLDPLIEAARAGELVVFRDPIDRFVPEWGELLGVGPVSRGPYVSSAAIAAARELGTEVLGSLARHQDAVDFERTHWRSGEPGYAFTYADQDVLNGLLAARDDDLVRALDSRLSATPPFDGLAVRDLAALRCSYPDGAEPFLVHHHVVKPWLEPTHHGVYSQLLRRLLIGDGLALRPPEEDVPPHLRRGSRAWATRTRVNARERLRWHVREPLAARLRGRGREDRG